MLQSKVESIIPCSFTYKVICIDDKFSKPVVLYRGKNYVNEFIKAILKNYRYCRLMIKNTLIKTLSWLKMMKEALNQVIGVGYVVDCLLRDHKVREYDHVSGKYRGSAYGDCNISLKLTKKFL